MQYLGDFATGATVRGAFNTRKSDGTPITLAGTPVLSVYKDGNTTETTTGVTLTIDFDSRTGHHLFAIDTSDAFFSSGSDFRVVITTGTVDSVSVVGVQVASFSLANRSALRPTTAGRTLAVQATGNVRVDGDAFGDSLVISNLATETTSQSILGRLPTTLVNGRMDSSVGAMAANTLTASALAADAVSEIATEVTQLLYLDISDGNFVWDVNFWDQFNDKVQTIYRLGPMLEQDGVVYRFTTNALEQAPGNAQQSTLLAVKAKTDLITTGQVTYTSPVGATGKISIPIIIGDDYLAANARAFEWTITARTGVVVGTASCRFGGTNEELNKSWLVTGTVSDLGGGQWKLSFDLSKTVTGALAEGYYRWSVELVSAGGTEITEVYSGRNVEVRNKQT